MSEGEKVAADEQEWGLAVGPERPYAASERKDASERSVCSEDRDAPVSELNR